MGERRDSLEEGEGVSSGHGGGEEVEIYQSKIQAFPARITTVREGQQEGWGLTHPQSQGQTGRGTNLTGTPEPWYRKQEKGRDTVSYK